MSNLDAALVSGVREKQEHNHKLHQMAAMLWEAWGERWEKRKFKEVKPKYKEMQYQFSDQRWQQLTACMLPKGENELFSIKNKLMNNTKEALAPSSQSRLHRTTCRTKPKVISRLAMSCPGSQHPAQICVCFQILSSVFCWFCPFCQQNV